MRLLIISLLLLSSFAIAKDAVAQDCTNPEGDLGVLRFNVDYGILQICTAQNWLGLHSMTCPDGDACAPGPANCDNIGDQCDDGSFYIGLSPEDGERVYMTDAAHETSIRWDEDPPCFRCGLGDTGATSIADGRANVQALRAYGGDNATSGNLDGFGAAKYCDGLNAIEAHGYDDWYLPAGGPNGSSSEINLIWLMVQAEGAVGGLNTSGGWYWSSSEDYSYYARIQRFSDGFQLANFKTSTGLVRCVRR